MRQQTGRRRYMGLVAVPYADGKCASPAIAEALRVGQLGPRPSPVAAGFLHEQRQQQQQQQRHGTRDQVRRACLLLRVSEERAIVQRVRQLQSSMAMPLTATCAPQ